MALKVCRRRRTQKLQNDQKDAALEDWPLHLEPSWVQLASPKVLFRGCKSAIRYAKVLFRGCKSAIRYAKTQNDLSPLWGRSDLGSLKHNTYATFFLTLHSLWGPSDIFFAKVPPMAVYRLRRHTIPQLGFAWFCVPQIGAPSFGAGNLPPYRAWVMMTVRLPKANSLKLYIMYYILYVTYYILYIIYYIIYIRYYILYVIYYILHIVHYILYIISYILDIRY